METVVIYNMGLDAMSAGLPRVAPNEVEYPIVSRYQPYHTVSAALSSTLKAAWLDGYDNKYARRR